jgi:hypothetical protein
MRNSNESASARHVRRRCGTAYCRGRGAGGPRPPVASQRGPGEGRARTIRMAPGQEATAARPRAPRRGTGPGPRRRSPSTAGTRIPPPRPSLPGPPRSGAWSGTPPRPAGPDLELGQERRLGPPARPGSAVSASFRSAIPEAPPGTPGTPAAASKSRTSQQTGPHAPPAGAGVTGHGRRRVTQS